MIKLIIISVFLYACNNSSQQQKDFIDYNKRTDDFRRERIDDKKLFDSTITIISKQEKNIGCNKKQIRIIFYAKTQNQDSLRRAANILTDDISIVMHKDLTCSHGKNVVIWFFESEKNERINAWRMMSTVVNGMPASSMWGEYVH